MGIVCTAIYKYLLYTVHVTSADSQIVSEAVMDLS